MERFLAEVPRISFTPEDAATATGFSRTRIFNAIRDGELTARKDGKATIIEIPELQRWVRSLPVRPARCVRRRPAGWPDKAP